MRPIDLTAELDDAAVLAEPLRRRLYEYVAAAGRDVGRDEAARAVGVDRALAAFHLDKLADAGFLDVAFRRLSGTGGPGAGRPAKVYRRSAKELMVTLPSRQYETLARLFAQALSSTRAPAVARGLASAAVELGRALGEEARSAAGRRPSDAALLRSAERTLARYGFAPRRTAAGELRLGNCPFDALARDYRALVCGANEELMSAFVRGLGRAGVRAMFDPQPGACCVALRWNDR